MSPVSSRSFTIACIPIEAYAIVIGTHPDPAERFAAEELKRCLELATGFRPALISDQTMHPYELVIGQTNRNNAALTALRQSLGKEGYVLKQDDTRLFITGQTPRGTLYGVYDFLEKYVGLCFCSSSFEDVLSTEVSDIPTGLLKTFVPRLHFRDIYWFDAFHPAFSARMKCNSGIKRDLSAYGGGVEYAGIFVHTLPHLAGTSTEPNDQPCLTDEAVYQKVLSNVRQWLADNPHASIISVSQNDSFADGRGCQCPRCRALDEAEGTPMGSLLTFVNRIADDIREEYPQVMVDTLAYRYTRTPPRHIVPRNNVIVRLCSIECCFSHPFTECDESGFVADVKAWSKICRNLHIWDYTTNFQFYLCPFPNLHLLYDNVRFLTEHHMVGYFAEGNFQSPSGEFGELRCYLLGKLMWDPDMSREDYESHMNRFLKAYYGEGWHFIREYIDLSSARAATAHLGIYDSVAKTFGMSEPPSDEDIRFLEDMRALWDKALALADDLHRPHVERSSLQIRYAQLYACWNENTSPAEMEDIYALTRKHGITYFSEGRPFPELTHFDTPIEKW